VDGGVPNIVTTWNFFSPHKRLPGVPDKAPVPLRTIFPSSTAPAHASFLTGAHPDRHGIVGNRFWRAEDVADIRTLAADPVTSLHPYDAASLLAPSVLDWLVERGAKVAAIQFPHTFSRSGLLGEVPSLYCLYAPGRDLVVPIDGCAASDYFGCAVEVSATELGGVVVLSTTAGQVPIEVGGATRLNVTIPAGELSIPVRLTRCEQGMAALRLGTAVLTLRFGLKSGSNGSCGSPSSLDIDYTADPSVDFHEAPRANWIAQTALDALDEHEPDVLFVRFNQADHAQEYLYWHAVRAGGAETSLAREQILDTYQLIDRCLGAIMEAVGKDASYLLFSDHGIDYVDNHLRPNVVLQELGLDDRMIFQGDSNIAYLYSDLPLRTDEWRRIRQALTAVDATIIPLTRTMAADLRLPWDSERTGVAAVVCGPHREFVYGVAGTSRQQVRSASHGYLPGSPAMNGFCRMFGAGTGPIEPPAHLVDLEGVVKRLWRAQEQVDRHREEN
jgi:hypothetical protein